MPELPEIETIRLDLESALRGETVVSFQVLDPRLRLSCDAKQWKNALAGKPWTAFRRKGKYLWIEFPDGWRLMFHMRMTGQLIIGHAQTVAEKPRLLITFASGKTLSLCDQRRFAEAWLLPPERPWPGKSPLGPDALNDLQEDQFIRLLRHRTTRIHPLLLDQRLLAGVGNIYAQEALFKAAIRPTRAGGRLSRAEASRLYGTLQETLQTAIVHRGSTSRNYRDAYGESGSAQTLHAVYRKGGTPCPLCRTDLKATRIGGRGAVYCARCQK